MRMRRAFKHGAQERPSPLESGAATVDQAASSLWSTNLIHWARTGQNWQWLTVLASTVSCTMHSTWATVRGVLSPCCDHPICSNDFSAQHVFPSCLFEINMSITQFTSDESKACASAKCVTFYTGRGFNPSRGCNIVLRAWPPVRNEFECVTNFIVLLPGAAPPQAAGDWGRPLHWRSGPPLALQRLLDRWIRQLPRVSNG